MNDEQKKKWRSKLKEKSFLVDSEDEGKSFKAVKSDDALTLLIEYGEEVRAGALEEVFAVVNTVPDYEVVAAVRALATKKEGET